MRVLLLEPRDEMRKGPWADLRWDRIVDLGVAGANSYARWADQSRCPVTTILGSLPDEFEGFHHVRKVLGLGCGRLIDEYGLDWWEILSILLVEKLETLILLTCFAETISKEDEIFVSRSGFHSDLLKHLVSASIETFPPRRDAHQAGLRHSVRAARRLSGSQVADVFWDKYDPGYQFRGQFARRRRSCERPVVLLPTAYVNVSRTGIAYANTVPEQDFFLVSTRRSGWMSRLPSNASAAWLSSYASLRDRSHEIVEMEGRWQSLLREFADIKELRILDSLGSLADFPERLRHGLEVRDAWRNVLDTEPVQAVLCADDSNPYTRIPLLLARERGLPNIACHHGALDGRYLFKRSYGDVILVKGKMEQDYLVRRCQVPAERVEIGAPTLPASAKPRHQWNNHSGRSHILFISEPFEDAGGRGKEFYSEVLPPLADLALTSGRTLIVKLHPMESRVERAGTVAKVLSPLQKSVTSIVDGPLTEDLLAQTWFGMTVLSTVATECAIRGMPCFLCRWLEYFPYGYVDQFIRFGAGIALKGPREIETIPKILEQYSSRPEVSSACWQAAAPERLMDLFSAPRQASIAAAG